MFQSDVANAVELAQLLFDLTQDEGDSVEICHPNPDFIGANSAICVVRQFGSPVWYEGESVVDCLRKAKKAEVTT
jgi:hypothetical protein